MLLCSRLDMCKEQHAMDRLAEMRTPVAATPGVAGRRLTAEEAPAAAAKEPFARQPLSKRFVRACAVCVLTGHCC